MRNVFHPFSAVGETGVQNRLPVGYSIPYSGVGFTAGGDMMATVSDADYYSMRTRTILKIYASWGGIFLHETASSRL